MLCGGNNLGEVVDGFGLMNSKVDRALSSERSLPNDMTNRNLVVYGDHFPPV